jgi:hypothetical protein
LLVSRADDARMIVHRFSYYVIGDLVKVLVLPFVSGCPALWTFDFAAGLLTDLLYGVARSHPMPLRCPRRALSTNVPACPTLDGEPNADAENQKAEQKPQPFRFHDDARAGTELRHGTPPVD